MDPFTLLVDVLATYRLTRLVTEDTFPPVKKARDWLLLRWPSPTESFDEAFESEVGPVNAKGRPVLREDDEWWAVHPHWFGELITCPYCASVWIAAGVLALRFTWDWWTYPALLLALAAGAVIAWKAAE